MALQNLRATLETFLSSGSIRHDGGFRTSFLLRVKNEASNEYFYFYISNQDTMSHNVVPHGGIS